MTVNTQGTVKWFNESKGFGFILSDTGEDLFAHYSEIKMNGFKVLREGQSKLGLHNRVLEFFKELHMGTEEDFKIIDPKKISGKFGTVDFIHLINVPSFEDKDKFIQWAYSRLNH